MVAGTLFLASKHAFARLSLRGVSLHAGDNNPTHQFGRAQRWCGWDADSRAILVVVVVVVVEIVDIVVAVRAFTKAALFILSQLVVIYRGRRFF